MLRPQIFTHAREWPSLASAPSTIDWGPPYNFFSKGVLNWLHISYSNFQAKGSSLIWDNEKRPKFGAI